MSDTKGARPLSPHLQIYRLQITSVLSITHRMTGVALGLGAVLLALWLAAAAWGPGPYAAMQGFVASWLGRLLLFGWTVALFYHLANGIRHLFWDAGRGFDLKTVTASGYAVLAATAMLTVIAWVAAYSMMRGR